MRLLTTSLMAVLAALAITACSGGSSSSSSASDQSDNTAASAASDNSASSSATDTSASSSDASMAATGDIPSYPGATTEAAGSSSSMGMAKSAAGKVMTTADSFDKVYAWYQKNMPAGSEKAHTTTPVETAVFMMGEAGKDQKSVTITVSGGKTMISIAQVKM